MPHCHPLERDELAGGIPMYREKGLKEALARADVEARLVRASLPPAAPMERDELACGSWWHPNVRLGTQQRCRGDELTPPNSSEFSPY